MTQFLVKYIAIGTEFWLLVDAPNRTDAARLVAAAAPGQTHRTVTHVMKAPTTIESGTTFNSSNELFPYITTFDVKPFKRVWVEFDNESAEIWVRDFHPEEDMEPTQRFFHVFKVEEVNDQEFRHWGQVVEVDE